MSTLRRAGGARPIHGCRSGSAMRASRRSRFLVVRCKASPSDSEENRRRILGIAREQLEGFSGVSVLAIQDFGAQPGDLNSLGYKDGIDQPPIEGSGVESPAAYGRPIKAGEFILGYPGEAGVPLPMPQPDILGRNGTY